MAPSRRRRASLRGACLALAAVSMSAVPASWASPAGDLELAVFDPFPGERVVAGLPTPIQWTTNYTGNVKLEYTVTGGSPQLIVASTPNDRGFTWTPPDLASTDVRIRISDVGGLPVDYSDGAFTVCDPYFNKGGAFVSGTGSPAQQVAFGDFNEDAVLDFVTTTAAGLSLRLGQGAGGVGNGTFGSAIALNFAALARTVIVADVNEDGRLDLVAGMDDGRMMIARGNGTGTVGNGTFASPTSIAGGTSLRDVIAADVNEDGRVDLVAADLGGDRVLVYAGGGTNGTSNGSFGAPSAIPVDGARVVRAADFDEDGIVDLAVGTEGSPTTDVLLLRGLGIGAKGDGTFARSDSIRTIGDVPDLEIGDFNEDGRVDLAWLDSPASALRVGLGTGTGASGDGHFVEATGTPTLGATSALVVADFDRDGRMDMAATNLTGDALRIFLGNGTGTVGNGTFVRTLQLGDGYDQMTALATEDLLEDNRSDLLVLGNKASAIPPLAFFGDFDICAAETMNVRLLAPQGAGLSWNTGQELEVRWTGSGYFGAVDVDLSRDQGARWETIGHAITETSWRWTVVPPASTTCFLRVRPSSLRNRAVTTHSTFTITNTTVDVPSAAPRVPGLSAAWPNPGGAAIRLTMTLARASDVSVDVIDVAGRRVRSLAGGVHEGGDHVLLWDGRRDDGTRAAPGVYFVDARWDGFRGARRIVRLD